MAYFVKIICRNLSGKEISFKVPWWNKKDLLSEYQFKEIEFAGEIDYELMVGKGTLKKIQIDQEKKASKFLFDETISKKIDEICDYAPQIEIVIKVYFWESGYDF